MRGDVQSLRPLRRLRLIARLLPNWYQGSYCLSRGDLCALTAC